MLDNVNNTIEGSGQIGAGQLTLIDAGTISATGTNTLAINLGSTGTITATGAALGVGTGGLVFQNGTYTNSGLIQASDGSSVTFQSGAVLTNDKSTGVLSGGTYAAVANGHGATLTVTGTAVTNDAAHIVLSGAGSVLSFGGETIEASLKAISKSFSLAVLGGRGYTTTNAITDSGTLSLGGGVFSDHGLNIQPTGILSGFGTLAGNVTSTGTIAASGGTLDLTGLKETLSGTIAGSGTLALSHGTTTLGTGTALSVSTVALINAATLNIAAPVSFAGTFDIVGNATLGGTGTFSETGLLEQTGHGVGTITDSVASSGTISVVSGGTLAFSGGLANTGSILDSGVFTDTAALTGGSLNLTAAASATIASQSGAGNSTLATLTTAGGALNTSGSTLTVTGDYVNTGAGKGNSYTPFAGVTGTIDGQGTQLAVVGVNGTTIASNGGTLTIAVKAGGTAQFKIENTGASGSAALRGALQTTVNGGSITGTSLSGSGVTAANFGPVAGGGASGVYTIHYNGGMLSNEAIHIASDFANVAGVTIDIVAQAQAPAHAVKSLVSQHEDAVLPWHPSAARLSGPAPGVISGWRAPPWHPWCGHRPRRGRPSARGRCPSGSSAHRPPCPRRPGPCRGASRNGRWSIRHG